MTTGEVKSVLEACNDATETVGLLDARGMQQRALLDRLIDLIHTIRCVAITNDHRNERTAAIVPDADGELERKG